MPGKNWFVAGAAALFIGVICLIVWMPIATPAPGVTIENAKRIHAAMKLEDVQALMGEQGELRSGLLFERESLKIAVMFEKEWFAFYVVICEDELRYIELEQTWDIKLRRWWRRNVW